jgi:hypothetical protein
MNQRICRWSTLIFLAGMSVHLGWGQFVDVGPEMELENFHTGGYLGHGVSMADFNGDEIDDMTLVTWEGNVAAYVGTGSGFEAIQLGITGTDGFEAKCVLWADIDNDQDQDLFVTYRLAPNRMWLNNGDMTFTEVSETCGIEQANRRSYGAAFGDYDNDGFLDLFIADYNWVTDEPRNELYHNNGDGTFTDVTFEAGLGDADYIQNFQGMWIDVNEDGWLDLFVIVDRIIYPNLLFVNQGDGSFIEDAEGWGLDFQINAMSTSVADFDRDNDLDIYVVGAQFDEHRLMVNNGDGFVDFNPPSGDHQHVNELSWAANWIDYNNDGWEDVYVNTGYSTYTEYPAVFDQYPAMPNRFYRNSPGGIFSQMASAVPNTSELSFCSSVGDWNQDGQLDIAVNRAGTKMHMLEGQVLDNHYLKVLPKGTVSNRDAIGTKLRGWTNGEVTYQMVFCGENYMGQNSRWEHFGLGTATMMDSLIVTWPSGLVDSYYDLPADTAIVVVEGETQPVDSPCEGLGADCYGCTYDEACNFSEVALQDDGSCDFTCLYDNSVCGPGTYWDPIALQCMQILDYDPCPSDINMDGAVTMADLLLMLVSFGTYCPD